MKNWKNKKFIGGLLTLVLLSVGAAYPELGGKIGAEAICQQVSCDA